MALLKLMVANNIEPGSIAHDPRKRAVYGSQVISPTGDVRPFALQAIQAQKKQEERVAKAAALAQQIGTPAELDKYIKKLDKKSLRSLLEQNPEGTYLGDAIRKSIASRNTRPTERTEAERSILASLGLAGIGATPKDDEAETRRAYLSMFDEGAKT